MDDSEPEGINRKGAAEPQPSRSDSRKGFDRELSGTAQGRALSFRPKGEIFLRSSHPLGMTDLGPSLSVAIIRLSDCSPGATNC